MTDVQFLTSVVAQKVSSLDQKVKKRHKKDGSGAKHQLISSTASLQISCGDRDNRSLFNLHACLICDHQSESGPEEEENANLPFS